MRFKIVFFLLLGLLALPLGLADHTPGHNSSVGGGLPSVVDFVETVHEVEILKRSLVPTMFVGGTEYEPFDPAKVFVQIDIEGAPVNNAICFSTAWFPNTTILFEDQMMAFLDRGIYFHDFTIPNQVGVFPVSVSCDFLVFRQDNFGQNLTIVSGNKDSGNSGDTYIIDGSFLRVSETVAGQRGFDMTFDFLDVPLDSNTSSIAIDMFVTRPENGNDAVDDFVSFWFFNWTNSSYVFMASPFDYLEAYNRLVVEVPGESEDFIDNGTLRMLINDSVRSGGDSKNTVIDFDYLSLITFNPQQNATVQVIRGGGELHVRNSTSIIVEVVDQPLLIKVVDWLLLVWLFLLCLLVFVNNQFYWYGTGFYTMMLGFGLHGSVDLLFVVGMVIGGVFVVVGGVVRSFGDGVSKS